MFFSEALERVFWINYLAEFFGNGYTMEAFSRMFWYSTERNVQQYLRISIIKT